MAPRKYLTTIGNNCSVEDASPPPKSSALTPRHVESQRTVVRLRVEDIREVIA